MSADPRATFKDGVHVVWCERCEQWTLLGQPYEMLEPGRFAHVICPQRGSRFMAMGRLRLIRGGGYSGTEHR